MQSGKCEIITVLVALSLNLLEGAGFCKNQVQTGKTAGHHNKAKSEKEYEIFCLDGEC